MQIASMMDKHVPVDAKRVSIVTKDYLEKVGAGELLEENGGTFTAAETWCLTLLHEAGLARRKCTTQAAKLPSDWEEKGQRLQLQV